MANPKPKISVETQFKPGQSGNPGGRPVGTRLKINAAFLNALSDDFEKHGKDAIKETREKDPSTYVKVCASLLPKQVEQTAPLDDLNDAELLAVLDHLRSRVAGNAGEGTQTAPGSTTTQ